MSNPRVIAGKARGMRLQPVPGEITRPITDRVKEALFNIIGPDILDATLLDLFGGTGAVGIEALSRGASFVRFIDLNRPAIKIIQANLETTHFAAQAQVVQMDAFQFLKQSVDRSFEYIFVAPPQYKGLWLRALEVLNEHPGWLSVESWLIVQIDPLEYQPTRFPAFTEFEQRKYGSTLLVFYEPSGVLPEANS